MSSYSPDLIDVFTPEGTLVASYGSGTLSYPAGIAINAEGCGESAVSSIYIARTNRLFTHSRSSSVVAEG